MKTYELTYIISPELSSDQAETKAKEIESAIQGREGIIIKQQNPTPKTLAYPINGHASGFMGTIEFQLESEQLPQVKEVLDKDVKISRNMVVVKEAPKFKKAPRVRIKSDAGFSGEAIPQKKVAEKEVVKEETTEDPKAKVELKDIDQQIDQILGE